MFLDVSLTNLCHAALVSSSNSPFTLPAKQPTRINSNCSNRARSCGSGAVTTGGGGGAAAKEAIRCSASERSGLSGNCRTNGATSSGSFASFTRFQAACSAASAAIRVSASFRNGLSGNWEAKRCSAAASSVSCRSDQAMAAGSGAGEAAGGGATVAGLVSVLATPEPAAATVVCGGALGACTKAAPVVDQFAELPAPRPGNCSLPDALQSRSPPRRSGLPPRPLRRSSPALTADAIAPVREPATALALDRRPRLFCTRPKMP